MKTHQSAFTYMKKFRFSIQGILFLFFFLQQAYVTALSGLQNQSINRPSFEKGKQDVETLTEQKQKILFIMPWMIAGGMERAFISMLNNFPLENAEIHVAIL